MNFDVGSSARPSYLDQWQANRIGASILDNEDTLNNPLGYDSLMQQYASTQGIGGNAASGLVAPGDSDFFSRNAAFGNKDGAGWLTGGAAVGSSLLNMYLGLSGLSETKKNNKFNRNVASANYEAAANTTNAELADRQRSRLASSGGSNAYLSESDYMKQYGVKSSI